MTIDPGQPDGPPIINLSTRSLSFSSLPRLVVGLLAGLVALAFVGWLVIGSVFGTPWYVAAPMSVFFGLMFVAWQVKRTWRGYAVAAVFALLGVAVLFAYWGA